MTPDDWRRLDALITAAAERVFTNPIRAVPARGRKLCVCLTEEDFQRRHMRGDR
jgi:hypothetical protein